MAVAGGLVARLERFAAGRAGLGLVGLWALAEAICWPIVPDVAIGLLVALMPRRTLPLFLVLVAGALAGTAVLYALALAAPDAVASMLLALPGIHQPMLDGATQTVAGGSPAAIALLGPGTPLKVYTWAWAVGPGTPLALAVGVVINRITRVGPTVLVLAVIGRLAPGFLRRHHRPALAIYALSYVVLYAIYWR